jgi:hypothetical protein
MAALRQTYNERPVRLVYCLLSSSAPYPVQKHRGEPGRAPNPRYMSTSSLVAIRYAFETNILVPSLRGILSAVVGQLAAALE